MRKVWAYEWGVLAAGHEARGKLDYTLSSVDAFVGVDGVISTYSPAEHNLDRIKPGTSLLKLWRETGDERYARAAGALREQLRTQPRCRCGGFWHKAIYPWQMWLDGVYMAGPFYAGWGRDFDEPEAFDDVVRWISLVYDRTLDERTGLLRHGWDESRSQRWADPKTGCSPHAWGRGLGWFAMALVDVLDELPPDHGGRQEVLTILARIGEAALRSQDPESGLWWQVLDQPARERNYLEASASCMFAYAFAKAARLGYLSAEYAIAARRAWAGIQERFVRVHPSGRFELTGICAVAGLGGAPYRDGSFDYYVGEPVVNDDDKGLGAYLLASSELLPLAGDQLQG